MRISLSFHCFTCHLLVCHLQHAFLTSTSGLLCCHAISSASTIPALPAHSFTPFAVTSIGRPASLSTSGSSTTTCRQGNRVSVRPFARRRQRMNIHFLSKQTAVDNGDGTRRWQHFFISGSAVSDVHCTLSDRFLLLLVACKTTSRFSLHLRFEHFRRR
jgi:hypothetical protein